MAIENWPLIVLWPPPLRGDFPLPCLIARWHIPIPRLVHSQVATWVFLPLVSPTWLCWSCWRILHQLLESKKIVSQTTNQGKLLINNIQQPRNNWADNETEHTLNLQYGTPTNSKKWFIIIHMRKLQVVHTYRKLQEIDLWKTTYNLPLAKILSLFPYMNLDLFFRFAQPSFMSLTGWFVAPFLVAVSCVIPGLKAFNSTRRVPRSNQRFKDYTAVLRAVLLKLAQAVLEARISGGSREK